MMHDYCQEFAQIKALLKQNPEGMSVTEISKVLKKNKNTTGRYLDILMISGHVDMRMYGMAKVFSLSQRVPLSAMLSYSKDLIMVLDKDSRIVSINDQFLALLHLTRKEVVGNIVTCLKSPEMNMQELIGALSSASPESPDCLITLRQQKEYGETIFRQRAVSTVFDDGAKGTTYILSDVTREILREREIREWEERFRMMAENIQDGLVIIENELFVFTSQRFSEITGYTKEELRSMNMHDLTTPEERQMMDKLYKKSQTCTEPPAKFQSWIHGKNGERQCIFGHINSVRQGDTISTYITITDVTAFAQREQELLDKIVTLEKV